MSKLHEKIVKKEEIELEENENKEPREKSTVTEILKASENKAKEVSKDRQISARINDNLYGAFTKINKIQGIPNNSALNMLVSKYVRENKALLDEDFFF